MAIYDEAVIDAQKLREVAENAAKQQILEAITPRIRKMINSRILHEQNEELESSDDSELEPVNDDDVSSDSAETLPVSTAPAEPVKSIDQASSEKSIPVIINNTGDIHIDTDTAADENSAVLTDQMAESLARMIKNEKRQRLLQKRIENLSKNHQLFKEAVGRLVQSGKVTPGQKRKIRDTYRKLAQEAISLRGEVKANGGGSQRLEGKLVETLKEMKTMSTRTRRNIFDFLFEGEDQDKKGEGAKRRGMEEAELVLSDDEMAGLADKGEDEIGDALTGIDISFEAGEEGEEGEEEEATDEEGDDEGGDEEAADEEGGDEDMDLEEADEADEADEVDEAVYEIDESALRRELGKMKRLRESRQLQARKLREARARRARMVREQAETQADQFGGAEEIGDVFYDVDEDSLVNVLADELGSVSDTGVKEARLRKAMKEANEYKKAAESLKGQLVEMNLFNAKLLYANKLMQNKDLTVKQQRAIVEALDNAKTLREAKLLYKSLSESLARRGQKSGALSEGTTRTVLGSSSRSTRSAQPASSGVEVDRWAVLAGIKG